MHLTTQQPSQLDRTQRKIEAQNKTRVQRCGSITHNQQA